MRPTALAILLGILMSGCSAPDRPAEQPAPIQESESQPSPLFELRDCIGSSGLFVFNDQPVRASLPPGYRPSLVEGTAGASVRVEGLACDVIVGNTTYPRLGIGLTGIAVAPPQNATGSDFYIFEWLFPVAQAPALADALGAEGWPVVDATVRFDAGTLAFQGPAVDYQTANAEPTGIVPTIDSGHFVRMHHEGQERHAMLDQTYAATFTQGTAGTALVATKGILATFGPASSGLWSMGRHYSGAFNRTDGGDPDEG